MEEKKYLWWPEGAEEPDRLEVFEWAKRLAWIIAKGRYRTEEMITELALVGFLQADSAWRQYRNLPIKQRTWVMGTVITNAQKAFILDGKPARPSKEEDQINPDFWTALPKNCPPESGDVDWERRVDSRMDWPAIIWAIHHILTRSERRVMLMVIQFPGISDAEISERLGDMTPGSVRVHKSSSRKKLRNYLGWS